MPGAPPSDSRRSKPSPDMSDVLWGAKFRWLRTRGLACQLRPLQRAPRLPCGRLCSDSCGSSQLESPHSASPGICNNSAQDCLFPQIPVIIPCFFSVFSSGNLPFLTLQSQSNHQKMMNTAVLCRSRWTMARCMMCSDHSVNLLCDNVTYFLL